MTRLDARLRLLAVLMSALAGFVDAVGFIELGGFFVSFMSGNSTRLAVGLAEGSSAAGTAAALIACFVAGVAAGSLLGHRVGERRLPVLLAAIALALAIAALAGAAGVPMLAIGLMTAAMGAENAAFETDGEVRLGLTYMTGALVKLGQYVARRLRGERADGGWLSALLWIGLVLGAVAGALAQNALGLQALWIAAGVAMLLAFAAKRPATSER